MNTTLQLVPLSLAEANAFVREHHRHHGPVPGCKFAIGIADQSETVCAVAIVGRPVSRVLDDGWTLEVTRLCTNGVRNAPSMLYRACWRAAQSLGYRRLITYTLPEEGGASLRAASFRCIGKAGGGSWSCPSRPRVDKHPTQEKLRWELNVN